jgi:hypothetical protein
MPMLRVTPMSHYTTRATTMLNRLAGGTPRSSYMVRASFSKHLIVNRSVHPFRVTASVSVFG